MLSRIAIKFKFQLTICHFETWELRRFVNVSISTSHFVLFVAIFDSICSRFFMSVNFRAQFLIHVGIKNLYIWWIGKVAEWLFRCWIVSQFSFSLFEHVFLFQTFFSHVLVYFTYEFLFFSVLFRQTLFIFIFRFFRFIPWSTVSIWADFSFPLYSPISYRFLASHRRQFRVFSFGVRFLSLFFAFCVIFFVGWLLYYNVFQLWWVFASIVRIQNVLSAQEWALGLLSFPSLLGPLRLLLSLQRQRRKVVRVSMQRQLWLSVGRVDIARWIITNAVLWCIYFYFFYYWIHWLFYMMVLFNLSIQFLAWAWLRKDQWRFHPSF